MTHATMPGLSLDATAKADDWVGPGLTYRVEAQFGLHVTKAQLHADLRAAPGCLAAHHPAVVISDDGRAASRCASVKSSAHRSSSTACSTVRSARPMRIKRSKPLCTSPLVSRRRAAATAPPGPCIIPIQAVGT
jgi:hypothetical protein